MGADIVERLRVTVPNCELNAAAADEIERLRGLLGTAATKAVTRAGCNYLSRPGTVCNKCGKDHGPGSERRAPVLFSANTVVAEQWCVPVMTAFVLAEDVPAWAECCKAIAADMNIAGRDSQHVLKAEPETADATDRETHAEVSPGGGPMGTGQPTAVGPVAGAPSEADVNEAVREVMAQAQVFASAWSLVGGPFDGGTARCLDDAEEAKRELQVMVRSLAVQAARA